MPMETDTIEFAANTHGDWFFHCHIMYHMMAGMNRVFSTENQPPNPRLPNKEHAYKMLQRESNMPHFMFRNDFASNGNDGMAMLHNARWQLQSEWGLGYNKKHGYEVETHLGRYIGKMQWLMPFIGFDWRYRRMGHNEVEKKICLGKRTAKIIERCSQPGSHIPYLCSLYSKLKYTTMGIYVYNLCGRIFPYQTDSEQALW